jgi:hypothetical protein
MSDHFIPVDVKRQIVREMADWLEGRKFDLSVKQGVDPVVGEMAKANWKEGYARAIFELRAAAMDDVEVPDDISEMYPHA